MMSTTTLPSDITLALLPRAIALDWGVKPDDRTFLRRIHRQGGAAGNRADRKRLNRLLGEFARAAPIPRPEPPMTTTMACGNEESTPCAGGEDAPGRYLASQDAENSPLAASKGLTIDLNSGWRVAEDELQWILQRRQTLRWRDRSFCRNRDALLRCIREYIDQPVDPAALSKIQALPELHA